MRHLKRWHQGADGFKRLLIAWTLILTLGTGYTLWSLQRTVRQVGEISHREIVSCTDPRGDLALRKQWQRVEELIRRTNLKPSDPQYLPPKVASRQFAGSYEAALREAGPPPKCLEGGG